MEGLLTNRDTAILLWTIVFFAFVLSKKDVRSSIKNVLVQFFSPKLIIPLLLSAIPAIALIIALNHYGLWSAIMTKTAVIWAIGTGFVSFLNTANHSDGKALFFNSSKEAIKFTVIIEFLVNFYVFPLYIELIFIPLIMFIVLLSTVANTMKDKKYEITRKFFEWLLATIGIGLFVYILIQFVQAPHSLFTIKNLEELLLPIILTFSYIPSIYLLGVYSNYESLFLRLTYHVKKKHKKVKWLCVRKAGLSLKRIDQLSRYIFREIAMDTDSNVEKIIKSYDGDGRIN